MREEASKTDAGAGFYAGPGSNVTMIGCVSYDNDGPGIAIDGASNVRIEDTATHGNRGGGIEVKGPVVEPPPTVPARKSWWSAVVFDWSVKTAAGAIAALTLAAVAAGWAYLHH